MSEESVPSPASASRIQEAVDAIVRSFDHPPSIAVRYSTEDGTKRTVIEVETAERIDTYEVVHDGHNADTEPTIARLDEQAIGESGE